MATILDLIGSLVVKGMILVLVFRLTIQFQDVLYARAERASLSQQLDAAVMTVQWDLKQAGYNATGSPIVSVDSNRITFSSDLNNDGMVESVSYDLRQRPGENRYYLSRTIDGASMDVASRVVRFNLQYFDSLGASTTNPTLVRSITVTLQIESDNVVDGRHPVATWRSRLFPMNL